METALCCPLLQGLLQPFHLLLPVQEAVHGRDVGLGDTCFAHMLLQSAIEK